MGTAERAPASSARQGSPDAAPKTPTSGLALVPFAAPGSKEPAAARARFTSLRVIIPAVAALLLAGALVAAAMYAEHNARVILLREMESQLLLQARNVALTSSGALLEAFPELTLQPILRDLLSNRPELQYALVVGNDGIIRGHPETRSLGQRYQRPDGFQLAHAWSRLEHNEELLENPTTIMAVTPVALASGQPLGRAIVAMRRDYLESAIADARKKQWVVLGSLLLAGSLVMLWLISQMLRPVSALRGGLERIGRGDLETPVEIRDHTEFGLLATSINRMAAQLRVARTQALEKERLASEIGLARQIQQSLLPEARMLRDDFVMLGAHHEAEEVGGDYFDLLPLPDGRIGLAIADVSGKGLQGCLIMSMLSALLHSLRTSSASPSDVLVALEENLGRRLALGTFITMFYGVLDPATGRIVCASAGHVPTLIYRGATGTVERFRSRAVPIGAIRGDVLRRTLKDEEFILAEGDVLVQFTDGISEANERRTTEEFGFDRIEAAIRAHGARGAEVVITELAAAVHQWSGAPGRSDDETLLVVGHAPGRAPQEDAAALLLSAKPGRHLKVETRLEALTSLGPWLRGAPEIGGLDAVEANMLESALHEICANIIEHGYENRASTTFDLWWIPDGGAQAGATLDRGQARDRIRRGCFLVRERGRVFDQSRHAGPDLSDPNARRRGRGLGLMIVERVMSSVRYLPDTTEGNLTVLRFDPDRLAGVPRAISGGATISSNEGNGPSK
jgi:serine phosphatase RsbU (regulator of sigma subunit)/anti-sigma regulatory factor (Ser/Thr protein kinase)